MEKTVIGDSVIFDAIEAPTVVPEVVLRPPLPINLTPVMRQYINGILSISSSAEWVEGFVDLFCEDLRFDELFGIKVRPLPVVEVLKRFGKNDALFVIENSDIISKDAIFNPYAPGYGLKPESSKYEAVLVGGSSEFFRTLHDISTKKVFLNSLEQISLFMEYGETLRAYAPCAGQRVNFLLSNDVVSTGSQVPSEIDIFSVESAKRFIEKHGRARIGACLREYGVLYGDIFDTFARGRKIEQLYALLQMHSPSLIYKEGAL
jgi:hypothetical protein